MAVLGRSPKVTDLGALNRAMRDLTCSTRSASVTAALGRSTTNAAGTSPQVSSGAATTAHSSTSGCDARACSTSMEAMFSPPEMITSLARSRTST